MRLYIAGPITGYPQLNRLAFMEAIETLHGAGHDVRCPFDNGLSDGDEWAAHMRADIRMLLDCDGVALLNGWDMSKGARLEEWIAYHLGMPRRSVEEWVRLSKEAA